MMKIMMDGIINRLVIQIWNGISYGETMNIKELGFVILLMYLVPEFGVFQIRIIKNL